MRWILGWTVLLALSVLIVPVVAGHGDALGFEGTVPLSAGEDLSFEAAIHWHRLTGRVHSVDSDDARLLVLVKGPDGVQETITGPAPDLRLVELIACCRGETWAEHTFTIRNAGDREVRVAIDLVLLHDNLAVTRDDAEPGAWWQTLLALVVVAGGSAIAARRPGVVADERAQKAMRVGILLLGVAWVGGALLALPGMIAFKTGPLLGSLATTAWFPMPGPAVNTHAVASVALMLLWFGALIGWAVARRRSSDPAKLGADRLVVAALGGGLVIALLFGLEYGAWLLAAVFGLVPAAIVLAGVLWPRGARRVASP